MKVLHVIQRYPPAVGGSETWCRELCQYLAATGDEMKVLTFDVVEEEEFWREPPMDQCTIRLGRLAWDDRVLVRRYKRSLPIYSLYHSLLKVVLDRWLRIYFYGPHSIEMYGSLLRGSTATRISSTSTPSPTLTTSSGIWRPGCAESRSSSPRTFTRGTRTTSGGATTGC